MKLDLYPKTGICLALIFLVCISFAGAQDCSTLAGTFTTSESRCMATGEINITATGGSGNYNYKAIGPVSSSFTSSNIISGLPAGTYTVTIKDVLSGCQTTLSNVVIGGDYSDPRFQLSASDVSCINGSNGTISVTNLENGRGPFTFTIVAPSAGGIGTSNTTGVFPNLLYGDYTVQLRDSCGGQQTRRITVQNFNWWIDQTVVTKSGCSDVDIALTLKDNKGNTNLSGTVFDGYQYGVVRSAGDTTWSSTGSFTFTKNTLRSLGLVVKDNCGNIKTSSWVDTQKPTVGSTVITTNLLCATFDASINGQNFLTSPQYCLFTSAFVPVSCNSTGAFTGLAYGSYFITVRDNCYDTTIYRPFTVNQPAPAVAATVSLTALTCSTFTASVTGQANMPSGANYCLYDNSNTLIGCNTTGQFTGLAYGSYCIKTTDICTGTVIDRCFTGTRPVPSLNNITTSGLGCSSFTANLTGPNLTNATYCVYDAGNNQIACNSTGIFPGLAYGSYCITVVNTCYDTTMTRCITVGAPVPSLGAVNISAKTCSTFTAAITSPLNISTPANYCLYDASNTQIACNGTGTFTGLAYGSYTIRLTNSAACFDTVIVRPFSEIRPVPAGAAVAITGRTCSTFRATASGSNLTTPEYCVYDNANVQVACNNTGVFDLPYGTYSVQIVNTCYDTTIVRNFSATATPTDITVTATATCTIGYANLSVVFAQGVAPYTVEVYNPGGALVRTVTSATSPVAVPSLPGLPAGMRYTVVGTDNCGGTDSYDILPNASWLNKSILANSKCPSGLWQNGSGDLVISSSSNFGAITPVIIKKNGVASTINYSTGSAGNYTFSNMEPATYIVEYAMPSPCANKVYDTFALAPYSYPTLQQSAAYQCDNNSFSVGASVTGGSSPFTYEVIGSMPSAPSIISTPQTNPVFGINNGTAYSLVRLRAVDVCGNATLNDVSILPLANTIVTTAATNCYYNNVMLAVDTIPNATYQWFKIAANGDSVLVGNTQNHNIAYFLPSDTGRYISKITVNSGCLTKYSNFVLNASCPLTLPQKVSLSGKEYMGATQLEWLATNDGDVKEYYIERSITKDGAYKTIGKVSSKQQARSQYLFTDTDPLAATTYYRIRITGKDDKSAYTNIVVIKTASQNKISVFPNPVKDVMNINFNSDKKQNYAISLFNSAGQVMYETTQKNVAQFNLQYRRTQTMKPGMYVLKVSNTITGEVNTYKVMFE